MPKTVGFVIPAVGVDDGLLAALPLGSGCLPVVSDALHLFEAGVVGVHHGLVLLGLPVFTVDY
jgi:hypothetical protein